MVKVLADPFYTLLHLNMTYGYLLTMLSEKHLHCISNLYIQYPYTQTTTQPALPNGAHVVFSVGCPMRPHWDLVLFVQGYQWELILNAIKIVL